MKRALALITVALGSVVTVGAMSTPATAPSGPPSSTTRKSSWRSWGSPCSASTI